MARILFVCLGNICRSPMAEFIMRDLVAKQGLAKQFDIASAGTSGWHDGEYMHCGTAEILDGLHIASHDFVSSKVKPTDFEHYDYLIAMDQDNLAQLEKPFGKHPEKMFVITDLIPHLGYQGIPDPYFTNNFDETKHLLHDACTQLLQRLQSR